MIVKVAYSEGGSSGSITLTVSPRENVVGDVITKKILISYELKIKRF